VPTGDWAFSACWLGGAAPSAIDACALFWPRCVVPPPPRLPVHHVLVLAQILLVCSTRQASALQRARVVRLSSRSDSPATAARSVVRSKA
jgi:hypothetical protein